MDFVKATIKGESRDENDPRIFWKDLGVLCVPFGRARLEAFRHYGKLLEHRIVFQQGHGLCHLAY
jgi:hypothetical protein